MLTINNTLDGYLKDIEIKGNTIQDADNLADIRSVGEKVEGQELYEIPILSCGKNLFDGYVELGGIAWGDGSNVSVTDRYRCVNYIKVKPNTQIIANDIQGIVEYDINKQYIRHSNYLNYTTTSNNTHYIRFSYSTSVQNKIQLEEGTVATEYEPYQEDKITILSPCQIEKVRKVADRIVEKNGVWGVEKNIGETFIIGNENTVSGVSIGDTVNVIGVIVSDYKFRGYGVESQWNMIAYGRRTCVDANNWQNQDNSVMGSSTGFWVSCPKSITTKQDAIEYLNNSEIKVIYESKESKFIPLPHDQQVKLRTFANKTNISFLTEIEGTIKAQVPKSLGATVNTHTTQIDNLNKELDRVKKLEESTVSTVETESDFTVVEATSNGYFEDVKLEGKTLMNKFIFSHGETIADSRYNVIAKDYRNITNIKVTIINHSVKPIWVGTYSSSSDAFVKIYKIEGNSSLLLDLTNIYLYNVFGYITDGWTSIDELKQYVLWVEGDHTQSPPSYFEGLKSVGDGTDEIVVLSCAKRIEFTDNKLNISTGAVVSGDGTRLCSELLENTTGMTSISGLDFTKFRIYVVQYKEGNFLSNSGDVFHNKNVVLNSDCTHYRFTVKHKNDGSIKQEDIGIVYDSGSNINKKQLLYYNNETQAWEKPVLREWDSIEKHTDGKYYYHKRSGEVVLNGSENFKRVSSGDGIDTLYFVIEINAKPSSICVSDKFIYNTIIWNSNNESCNIGGEGKFELVISKSKLSTQDVEGFKQWLSENNVTVVYQLAEEKVYECTNIDLITYTNETNYIVESGAISPKSTLKVHNNISNVVSLLQKKVSLLESNITNYMITQNRLQLASTYSADSVTFKVDYYAMYNNEAEEYNNDLYDLILNNILVGKDNYDYDKMFTMILDYASWNQISWEQFDILVGLMDMQHNPPIEELPTEDEIEEDIIEEETPVE